MPFEFGTLHVRENRSAATSGEIAIGFARLRAHRPTGAPAIVFLPGGPGTSYLDAFTETTENARRRLRMFQRYAAAADVIVLDQRGFSARGTRLRTPHVAGGALDRPGSVVATAEAWRTLAAAAGPANPGRDTSAYTVTECAADVAELAAALGYLRISLLGTSFGSQWAFAVMRRYPELVARAVLSGVEPLDHGFDMPSSVLAAMQRIAVDAEVDPVLQPYLPEGGLMAALAALRERFAGGPMRVEVADATSGAKHPVVLGLEDLQAAVIPSDADAWPAFVLALYHGHYEGWARAELGSQHELRHHDRAGGGLLRLACVQQLSDGLARADRP